MNLHPEGQNPEILREKAQRMRPIRQDLKGVMWTMLGSELIQKGVSVLLVSILIGWQLRPNISEGLTTEALAALIDTFRASDVYANAVPVMTIIVAALGVIPAVIYAKKRDIKPTRRLGPNGLGGVDVLWLLLGVMGIGVLGSLGTAATEVLFNRFGLSIYVDIVSDQTAFSYWCMALYAVIIAPLIEEYMFRGVLLEGMLPYGERFAVMSCAALFGLMHGNLMQLLPAVLVGWFLGYVRVKTGSWGVCVLLHGLSNAVNLLIDGLTDHVGDSAAGVVNIVWIVGLALAFAHSWRRLRGRYDELGEPAPEEAVGYGALFSAPALIWVYLVFRSLVENVTRLS